MKKISYILLAIALITISIFALNKCGSKNPDRLTEQGIRPDVEQAINKEFPSSRRKRLAAIQLARMLQRAIDNPEDALAMEPEFNTAIACVDAIDKLEPDSQYLSLRIVPMVVNTWARSRAYVKYNAKFSGKIIHTIKPDLKKCDFDASNDTDN